MEQHLIGRHPFTVGNLPVHRHPRVQLPKHVIHPGGAADDGRIAGDDGGCGQAFGRDQLRGDVAAADVFKQRTAHVGFDFGGQIGET
ncbi:hypothetical protein D3C81_1635000 [compost metagenome]